MNRTRLVSVAVILGVGMLVVTFLTAANPGTENQTNSASAPTNTQGGVVVFGNVDIEPGLIPLFPECFPQPCRITEILVNEGDVVEAGKPLVRFDVELADQVIREARAGLARAESALERARAAHRRAEANVDMAKQAMETHEFAVRTQTDIVESKDLELKASQFLLEEEKRKAEISGIKRSAEIKAAEAKMEAAAKLLASERTKLEAVRKLTPLPKKKEAEAAVKEAEAAVAQQKATLDKAETGKRMLTITAPSKGTIFRNLSAVGLTFGPQSKQPALWFQPEGALIIRAEVDQEWATRVYKNQAAIVHDESNSSLTWKGIVTKISSGFLPKRATAGLPDPFLFNEPRVLECIIELNKNQDLRGLRIGQRVKVSLGSE